MDHTLPIHITVCDTGSIHSNMWINHNICGLIIIVWSACNPNTFSVFGNAVNKTIKTDETVLNDEYECDADDSC